MEILFYFTCMLAIVSTAMVIMVRNAVHALLFLIVSLIAVSIIFFILGAPFIAALEVIIYAGAIMVLFVFVIMMLYVDRPNVKGKDRILNPKIWVGPSIIALILAGEMIYILINHNNQPIASRVVSPVEVGQLVFTKYALVVDLAGFLLAAGIVGAYHLGQKDKKYYHRYFKNQNKSV